MIYIEVRLQGPIVTPKSDGLAAPKFAGLVPKSDGDRIS